MNCLLIISCQNRRWCCPVFIAFFWLEIQEKNSRQGFFFSTGYSKITLKKSRLEARRNCTNLQLFLLGSISTNQHHGFYFSVFRLSFSCYVAVVAKKDVEYFTESLFSSLWVRHHVSMATATTPTCGTAGVFVWVGETTANCLYVFVVPFLYKTIQQK